MRNYLKEYVESTDKLIKDNKITKKVIDEHLIKINFFQHERLIHLLVTLFYGLFLFISVYISTFIVSFIIITFLVVVILIFYVRHYFFMENNVQYLYKQYDEMKKLI